MSSNLEKAFEKIGANVSVITLEPPTRFERALASPLRLDIIEKNGIETFQVAVRHDAADSLEVSVLEVVPKERHLVLLARLLDESGRLTSKNHYLCGFDERHLFVAQVGSVSTVAAAKASLKPALILARETGLNTRKRNRRKTENFKRQGEWFFIPSDFKPGSSVILKNEPLSRGTGSKPHIVKFATRFGGMQVMVCKQYPLGLTREQYERLLKREPRAKHLKWRTMFREPTVHAKGSVRHPDHATIVLDTWHRVLMNTEQRTESIAFLD